MKYTITYPLRPPPGIAELQRLAQNRAPGNPNPGKRRRRDDDRRLLKSDKAAFERELKRRNVTEEAVLAAQAAVRRAPCVVRVGGY